MPGLRNCQISIEFYSEKFDEVERDNREKEETNNWKKRHSIWIKKDDLNRVIVWHEQCCCWNSILVHDIKESENEDTDVLYGDLEWVFIRKGHK